MHLTEKIILVLLVVGLLLWQFGIALVPGKMMFVGFSALLMIYYAFFGFAYYSRIHLGKIFVKNSYVNVSGKNILAGILSGISYAVLISGILFQVLLWPGAVVMGFSTAPVALVLLVSVIMQKVSNPDYRPSNFYRSILLSGTLMLLIALPFMTKAKLFYAQYPDAVIEAFENYNNSHSTDDYNIVASQIAEFEKK